MMNLKNRTLLSLVIGSFCAGVAPTAFGHGALVSPPARQVACIESGMAANCNKASADSNDAGQSIYTWQELTGFVYGNHSAAEARKVIPSHLICSGTSKGSGFSQPSAEWRTTTITPNNNGQVTMRYGYTQPHNVSWIEFYISKKGFNPAEKALGWDDIELLDTVVSSKSVSSITGQRYNKYEDYKISIPEDRSGRAVIFTRWQRQDAAGEGFYGCSDVIIDRNGGEQPPVIKDPEIGEEEGTDWFEFSKFAQNHKPAVGNYVHFRTMGGIKGNNLVDIRKKITSANVNDQWISELAYDINTNHSNIVLIGKQDGGGIVTFDPANLRGNGIFLRDKNQSAVLTVEKATDAPVAVAPADFTVTENAASRGYDLDGSQSLNATSYLWTIIDSDGGKFTLQERNGGSWVSQVKQAKARALIKPNTHGKAVYQLTVTGKDGSKDVKRVTVTVKTNGAVTPPPTPPTPPTPPVGDFPAWDQGKTYVTGDKVSLNNVNYIAKNWTRSKPGVGSDWTFADASVVTEWSSPIPMATWSPTVEKPGKRRIGASAIRRVNTQFGLRNNIPVR